eukprot:6202226-Pleurochrysis_carterae.AAC.1
MADEESEYCADPELVDEAEAEAAAARRRVAALDGCRPLVGLLDASDAPVLLGAGSALFNLAIERENADALLRLGALPKLQALISHDVTDVAAAMAGVLMNCCASSPGCRDALDQQDLLGTLLPLSRNSFDAKDSGGSQFELLLRLIGLLNNLLLHAKSARAMRDAKGIDHVVEALSFVSKLHLLISVVLAPRDRSPWDVRASRRRHTHATMGSSVNGCGRSLHINSQRLCCIEWDKHRSPEELRTYVTTTKRMRIGRVWDGSGIMPSPGSTLPFAVLAYRAGAERRFQLGGRVLAGGLRQLPAAGLAGTQLIPSSPLEALQHLW